MDVTEWFCYRGGLFNGGGWFVLFNNTWSVRTFGAHMSCITFYKQVQMDHISGHT